MAMLFEDQRGVLDVLDKAVRISRRPPAQPPAQSPASQLMELLHEGKTDDHASAEHDRDSEDEGTVLDNKARTSPNPPRTANEGIGFTTSFEPAVREDTAAAEGPWQPAPGWTYTDETMSLLASPLSSVAASADEIADMLNRASAVSVAVCVIATTYPTRGLCS